LVVLGTVRLHRPQKETWRTNEMRVYRVRIFEIRDPQGLAAHRQPARRPEESRNEDSNDGSTLLIRESARRMNAFT